MVFTTQCPQCGKILWFASNLAGKLTICPACGTVIKLTPPPDAPPAAPQPEDAIPFAVQTPPEAAAPPISPGPAPVEQPATSPFEQIQADAAQSVDSVPNVVEQSYLTHQAAA